MSARKRNLSFSLEHFKRCNYFVLRLLSCHVIMFVLMLISCDVMVNVDQL